MQHDDVLMGTDAGFQAFMQALSGGTPSPVAQGKAAEHPAAGLNGISASVPAQQNGTPDEQLFAPGPPETQAQLPLPYTQWQCVETGGACLQRESSSSGNSMGGVIHKAGAARISKGAAAQPNAPQRRSSGGNRGISIFRTEEDRDRNRAAQKAFRTRKKEREAAKEAQLADLSARLGLLELEKRALLARNALLERAVAASGVPAPGSAPGSPGSAAAPASAAAVVLVVQGKGGRVIKPSAVWKNNLDWGPDDTLELSLGEAGTALRLDRAMLRRNAVPDIRRAWKASVNKMAALLPEAGKHPEGPAAAKIKLLVAELISIPAFGARAAPGALKALFLQKMEEDVPFAPKASSRDMWKRILENMGLSAEQKAALAAGRRDILARFGELLHERRTDQARLRTSTLALLDCKGSSPMNGNMVGRYCELRKDSKQLEANLEALQHSKCVFLSKCWRQILLPIQCASFAVQAYPWFPDILAILALVAEEEGRQPVRQCMTADKMDRGPVLEEQQ